MTGIRFKPANLAALSRRSPIINSYWFSLIRLTTGGCRIPISLIDAESSLSASSSKTLLGCFGFGFIDSISTSSLPATGASTPVARIGVGINASKFLPKPPRFVLIRQPLHL